MPDLKGKPAIILDKRLGNESSPFSSQDETLIVNTDGRVILSELPFEHDGVVVNGLSKAWYEIKIGLPNVNQYKVDYVNKIVTFNESNIGKQLNFQYKGTGHHYYSASSIYTEENNGIVTETLKQLTDSTKNAKNDAITKMAEYKNAEDSRTSNENTRKSNENDRSTNESTRQASEDNRKSNEILRNTKETERVNKETERLNKEIERISSESTRISSENTRISNENTRNTTETVRQNNESNRKASEISRETAEATRQERTTTAVNNVNTLVEGTKFVEPYNSTTSYIKNNVVNLDGASYMAKKTTKGNSPTGQANDPNWGVLARKGTDGSGTVHIHTDNFIATEGQKDFTLTHTYDLFQNRTEVSVGGVPQKTPDNYEETGNNVITLLEGVPAGTPVIVKYFSEAVVLQADYKTQLDTQTNYIWTNRTNIENLTNSFKIKHNEDGTFKVGTIKGSDILDGTISNNKISLTTIPTETGKAIRWEEFTLKHNNDGTFKGIDHIDMNLSTIASTTKKPVRWDEFSTKHNNDGTFKTGIISTADIGDKVITNQKINLTSPPSETGKAIRWDEFSVKHSNDGNFIPGIITSADIANNVLDNSKINISAAPTSAGKAVRWDEFSKIHNNDGTFKSEIIESADIKNLTVTNEKISNTASIASSKLAIQKMYKKSQNVIPSSVANTFGTTIDLLPPAGFVAIIPQMIEIVFGGTFGTETLTVDITVTYNDASTGTITKTGSSVGSTPLTNTDLFALIKDNVFITKIAIKTKSSIASTTATSTINHFGFYL